MSSTTQVETVTTSADKAKLAAAGALVIAGVAAFYLLGKQDLWLRIVTLLVLLSGAVGVFFTSAQGKELIAFGQDSWKELQKVVWPSKQEARQMTLYVFAFVVVMALFLWLVDKSLEWLLYSVILGWKA
jgi:preprotein translocase subunit SecE